MAFPGALAEPAFGLTDPDSFKTTKPIMTKSSTNNLNGNGSKKAYKITTETGTSITKPSTWCWPFIIYIVLSIIGFISNIYLVFSNSGSTKKMSTGQGLAYLIFKLIFYIFFGWLIYYLCKKGHTGWAWVVLLLPMILSFIFIIFFFGLLGAFGIGAAVGGNMNPNN